MHACRRDRVHARLEYLPAVQSQYDGLREHGRVARALIPSGLHVPFDYIEKHAHTNSVCSARRSSF